MDDELAHLYDPSKRRDYYLRTRNLKGRTRGSVKPSAAKKKTRAQRQAERRRHLEAEVSALKSRLEKLRDVLAAETKKAQARSGVKPSTVDSKKASIQPASNGKTEKLTAAQESAKAKADKKRREKENPTLDEQVKSLNEKIKTIRERIAKMRKNGSIGANHTK